MERKAVRKTKVVFGALSFPVKIIHIAKREDLPPKIIVHNECGQEFESQIMCHECREIVKRFIPVSLETKICPHCHKKVETPLKKFFCKICQKEIGEDQTELRYKLSNEKSVKLIEEEEERLKNTLPKSKDIRIVCFVKTYELDQKPYLGETCYALVPENGGELAFQLFASGLSFHNAAALATVLISQKYYKAMIIPKGNQLLLWTMYFTNEFQFPEIQKVAEEESYKDLLDKMQRLIGSSISHLEPERHLIDERLAEFRAIIAQKEGKGEKLSAPKRIMPEQTACLARELNEEITVILKKLGRKSKKTSKK